MILPYVSWGNRQRWAFDVLAHSRMVPYWLIAPPMHSNIFHAGWLINDHWKIKTTTVTEYMRRLGSECFFILLVFWQVLFFLSLTDCNDHSIHFACCQRAENAGDVGEYFIPWAHGLFGYIISRIIYIFIWFGTPAYYILLEYSPRKIIHYPLPNLHKRTEDYTLLCWGCRKCLWIFLHYPCNDSKGMGLS